MTLPTGTSDRPIGLRKLAGFTLIELILVLLLLGLAASLVSPMMGRFSRGRAATDTAAHMLAIMQYAQDQAAITGSAYRLYWDESAGTYWIEASSEGRFSRIHTEAGRKFELAENMTMRVDGTVDQLANGYIQFDPDGGHDVLVIYLTDGSGRQVVIGSASPGEPYRIGDPLEVVAGR